MRLNLCVISIIVLSLSCTLFAQSKKELQQRAESRYPQIKQLKSAGVVGESSDGLLDFVKADNAAQNLITEENTDRKALYALIARETNTTSDTVAQQAGARNISRAQKGEFVKEGGQWRQK